ncbi:MAG: hypothetical protein B7733_24195 [Myxococcales bacterium FL481]|nr:MAG: hypothetical protein B7733_24195 [Myxococcales bacterium FL481]
MDSSGNASPPDEAQYSHRWANVFITVFLVVQVALPLRYYLRPKDDRQDERFAWRMFSSLGRRKCTVDMLEFRSADGAGKPVKLRRDYQGTWVTLLQKMRPLVVEKVLRTRCQADEDIKHIDYKRQCTTTAGASVAPDHVRYDCAEQRLDTVNEASP